jgi:hypothetical protein
MFVLQRSYFRPRCRSAVTALLHPRGSETIEIVPRSLFCAPAHAAPEFDAAESVNVTVSWTV